MLPCIARIHPWALLHSRSYVICTQTQARSGEMRKKKKKHMMRLMLGYVGTSYAGLQWQGSTEGVLPIELVLWKAIYHAGGILESNYVYGPSRVGWSRSSRTDKGVHSVATIVSLKMEVDEGESGTSIVEAINAELPQDVRVFSCMRAAKSFKARAMVTGRVYDYLLPRSALPGLECLPHLRQILQSYEGVHSFHSFRRGGMWGSVSDEEEDQKTVRERERAHFVSKQDDYREIVSFTASDLISLGSRDDGEVIVLRVSGTSFLQHQIRKMVGTALGIVWGTLPPNILDFALDSPFHLHLPLAPATPLILCGGSMRETRHEKALDMFDCLSPAIRMEIERFRTNVVNPAILRTLTQDNEFNDFRETILPRCTLHDTDVKILMELQEEWRQTRLVRRRFAKAQKGLSEWILQTFALSRASGNDLLRGIIDRTIKEDRDVTQEPRDSLQRFIEQYGIVQLMEVGRTSSLFFPSWRNRSMK